MALQRRSLTALGSFFEELAHAAAEAELLEAGEYHDPFEFADAALNDLPAIAYALNAGLPVIGWSPAAKNPAETERVMRAMRQFDEQVRLGIMDLVAGRLTMSRFYDRLTSLYTRHATNSYTAGRRAMGDLRPLSFDTLEDLDDAMGPDLARIRNLQTDLAAGGFGALLTAMILDPTNYLGSGLPGDPFAGLPPPLGAGKKAGRADDVRRVTNRAAAYSRNLRQYSHAGELDAVTSSMPGDAALCWWVLGPADHCIDCLRLSDGSPYFASQLDGMGIHPGSGHTRCGGNCQCYLQYDIPSQVCGDLFSGGGLADLGILEAKGDGEGANVWVQEAASCRVPLDVRSLNPDAAYDVIDDADAFDWDADMATLIEADDPVAWTQFATAQPAVANALSGALAAVPGPRAGLQVTRYAARDAQYHLVWQETADAIRFEIGATTSGMTIIDPDFTLRALHDLSARAAAAAKRLEVNGDLAGDGLKRWLTEIGSDQVNLHGQPPTVTPRFAEAPKPNQPAAAVGRDLLDEIEALPSWPEMSLLQDTTPEDLLGAINTLGGNFPKRVYRDPAGNQWLAKSQPTAKAVDLPSVEVAAAALGHEMGLRMPPVRVVEIERPKPFGVQRNSLQPMVPDSKSLSVWHADWYEAQRGTPNLHLGYAMDDEMMRELARHAVLDFVIANTDSHMGNFVVDDLGRLWGVDKGMAFAPVVAAGTTPEALFFSDTMGGTFGDMLKGAGLARTFHKVRPEDFARVLDQLDAISDARFAELLGDAVNVVMEPFGTYDSKLALLLARKNTAREGFEDMLRTHLGRQKADNLSAEWQTWLADGGTFRRAAAEAPRPLKVVPPIEMAPPTGAQALPAHMRSTATQMSTVGNNHAAWQEGFTRARSRDEALARMEAVLPRIDREALAAMSHDQLNVILARIEHLDGLGFDQSVIGALTDFRAVPVNLRDQYVGITLGDTIRLKHDNAWAFFPGRNTATVFNDMGGVYAHEFGHVLFHDLSTSAQTRLIDLHKAATATARRDLSRYATESLDEWFSEAFAMVTAPGYVKGSLKYDEDLLAILAADGRMKALQAASDAPAWPPLADLSPVTITGQAFKGQSEKALFVGDDGVEWLVKTPKYGPADATTAALEAEVTRLADELGVTINRVGVTEDGRTIQRILEDAEGAWFPEQWTDQQWRDMADHWVFDHLLGNVDGHKGQFLVQGERLIGLDKDVAWWGLTDMRGWDESLEQHAFFEGLGALDMDEAIRLLDEVITPAHIARVVDRVDAISDEAWLARWRPHIDALMADKGPLAPTTRDGWESLILRRKRNLRTDMQRAMTEMFEPTDIQTGAGLGLLNILNRVVDEDELPDTWRLFVDDPLFPPGAPDVLVPLDLPVAAAVSSDLLPLPPEPPPVPAIIAKGPYAKSTEMVPLDTLDALSPEDGINVLAQLSAEQRETLLRQMTDIGPTQPVVIEYHPKTRRALVTQGHADLAMAQFLKQEFMPARVIRRNEPFGLDVVGRTVEVQGPVGGTDGWIPLNMTPSEMLGDRPLVPGGALSSAPAKPEPPPKFLTPEQAAARQNDLEGAYIGWTGTLAEDEAVAVGAYVSPSKRGAIDGFLNNTVQIEDVAEKAAMRATIDALDAAVSRGVVPGPVTVYRGWSGKVPRYGAELDFRTFVPATTDASKIGANTLIRFRLVEGDTAVPITNGMLLPRDTALKVTRVRDVTMPDGTKKTLVDADLVPPRTLSTEPPIEAPAKAWFKPMDDQVYTLPGSDLPVNAPRQQWSGRVPDEPALPPLAATPDEKIAAREAAKRVTRTYEDVASGKVDVAYSWTAADDKAAKDLGLVTAKIGDAYMIAVSDEALDPFRAYMRAPGATHSQDEFWHLLGYTDNDLDIIDRANDIQRTKRLSAGVVIVEPDGRMWLLAPKNEYAGYQNTWVKGGVDEGESVAATAVREVYEEGGLTVELDSFLGDYVNTDGTGITRMYIGHRTGGGPLWAHLKETHEMRLVTPDEAQQMLTRHKKPDARDQAILADAVAAVEGTPGIVDWSFGVDEVSEFAAKTAPGTPSPPRLGRAARERAAINPVPEVEPPSVSFGYDKKTVDDLATTAVTTPPADKFPYSNTRYTTAAGEQQPTYWRVEGGGSAMTAKAPPSKGPYSIEAWKGMEALGFTTKSQMPALESAAYHYTADLGADRVLVRNADGEVVARWNGILWQSVKDEKIAKHLVDQGQWDAANLLAPDEAPAVLTPTAGPAWQTPQEMVDDLHARYGAESDFAPLLELDFDIVKPVMAELDTLFERYGAVGSFRGVKVKHGAKTGELASIARADPAVPGSYLYLPEWLFGSKAAAEKTWQSQKSSPNWAVMSKASSLEEFLRVVTAHEVGHEYMGLNLWSRFGAKGDEIRKQVDTWFKGADGKGGYLAQFKKTGITQYGSKNEHEAWAEAFAAAVGPLPVADPRIDELRTILNTHYPPKALTPPPAAVVTGSPKRVFWANSKKQLADPQQRLAVHVAHINHLAAELVADTTISTVRISDDLLDGVPGLADILVAGGAKKVTMAKKTVTEISRAEFLALSDSIVNNVPLGEVVPHIPTAPLAPQATVVSIGGGYEVKPLGNFLDAAAPNWNEFPAVSSTTFSGLSFGGDVSIQHAQSSDLLDQIDVWGTMPPGGTTEKITLMAAEMAAVAKYLDLAPGFNAVRFSASLMDEPPVRAWLVARGGAPGVADSLVFTRQQMLDFLDEVKVSTSNEGYALDWLNAAALDPAPAAVLPPPSDISAYVADKHLLDTAATTFTMPVGEETVQAWTVGGQGFSAKFIDDQVPGVLSWSEVAVPASASSDLRAAYFVRQFSAFADRAEMFGLDSVYLSPLVGAALPSKVLSLLESVGVDILDVDDIALDLSHLQAIRALAALPPFDAPLTWPAGAPLADVLSPDIKALVSHPGTLQIETVGGGFTGVETDMTLQIDHGKTLRVELVSPKPGGFATAGGRTADLLRVTRAIADDATKPWVRILFRNTELSDEFRGIVKHYGATEKAGYIALDINDARRIRDDIVDGAGAAVPPAVPVGPTATTSGYDAAAVASELGVLDEAFGKAMLPVILSAQDDTAGALLTTVYKGGDGDFSTLKWGLVGDAMTVESDYEVPLDVLYAFVVKMRKATQGSPVPVNAVEFADSMLTTLGTRLLEAAGAQEMAGGFWRLATPNLHQLADQIESGLKTATVGAAAPAGSAVQALKATGVTTTAKIDAYTPLNITTYGSNTVEWRRLSNDLQIHSVTGATGPISEEAWAAHMVAMADFLDATPKVQVMRVYAATIASLPPSFATTLDSLKIGKPGKGGQIVLTRDEVLTLRDEYLAAAAPTPEALPSTPAFEPVIGPQYGFDGTEAGALDVAIEPLKWNFEKRVYTGPAQTVGAVTVRHRTMAKDILWSGISGGSPVDQTTAMARWLADMGDRIDTDALMERLRFEALDKMPLQVSKLLTDNGAYMSGKYMMLDRKDVLALRDALTPEFGHTAAKTVVAATVPPPALTNPNFLQALGTSGGYPGVVTTSEVTPQLHTHQYANGTSFSVSQVFLDPDVPYVSLNMDLLAGTSADDALVAFLTELNSLVGMVVIGTYTEVHLKKSLLAKLPWGAKVRDVLTKAGATEQMGDVVIGVSLAENILKAIQNGTPLDAVGPGTAIPPAVTSATAGAKLSAQLGYDEQAMADALVTAAPDVNTGSMAWKVSSPALFGDVHGTVGTTSWPGMGATIQHLLTPFAGTAKSPADYQFAVLKALTFADGQIIAHGKSTGLVVQATALQQQGADAVVDLLKAHGATFAPAGSGFLYIDKDNLHALALKIDANAASPKPLAASAAAAAPLPTTPDPVTLIGLANDPEAGSLVNTGVTSPNGTTAQGNPAFTSSYAGGAFEAGWYVSDATQVIVWNATVSSLVPGGEMERRAVLAFLHSLAKRVEVNPNLKGVNVFPSAKGGLMLESAMNDLLKPFHGHVGGMDRASILKMGEAIEDALNLAPISAASQPTVSILGGWKPDNVKSLLEGEMEMPVTVHQLPSGMSVSEYSVAGGDVMFKHGYDGGDFVWDSYALGALGPQMQKDALGVMLGKSLLQAQLDKTGLIVSAQVVDNNPGIKQLLLDLGAVPHLDGGDLRIASYDVISVLGAINSDALVTPAAVTTPVPPLAKVAAPTLPTPTKVTVEWDPTLVQKYADEAPHLSGAAYEEPDSSIYAGYVGATTVKFTDDLDGLTLLDLEDGSLDEKIAGLAKFAQMVHDSSLGPSMLVAAKLTDNQPVLGDLIGQLLNDIGAIPEGDAFVVNADALLAAILTPAPASTPAPGAVVSALGKYGIDSAALASVPMPQVTDLKYNFRNHVFTMPSGEVTVKLRVNQTTVSWESISAKGVNGKDLNAALTAMLASYVPGGSAVTIKNLGQFDPTFLPIFNDLVGVVPADGKIALSAPQMETLKSQITAALSAPSAPAVPVPHDQAVATVKNVLAAISNGNLPVEDAAVTLAVFNSGTVQAAVMDAFADGALTKSVANAVLDAVDPSLAHIADDVPEVAATSLVAKYGVPTQHLDAVSKSSSYDYGGQTYWKWNDSDLTYPPSQAFYWKNYKTRVAWSWHPWAHLTDKIEPDIIEAMMYHQLINLLGKAAANERVFFLADEAMRALPHHLFDMRKLLDDFGAQKKTLKVGKLGSGRELTKDQVKALYAALTTDVLPPNLVGAAVPAPSPGIAAPPSGAALSPPPHMAPTATTPTPVPSGVGSPLATAFAYDETMVKNLVSDMTQPNPSLTVNSISATAKTQVFEDVWLNGSTVRWAEEQFGDARVARIRAVGGGMYGSAPSNALLATMHHMAAYLDAHPNVDRLLINKKALEGTPGLTSMLKASPAWKETKDYFVAWKADLNTFIEDVVKGDATWATPGAMTAPLPSGPAPALGAMVTSVGGVPTVPTPSFIYDFDSAKVKTLHQQATDTIGAADEKGAVPRSTVIGAGVEAGWSVSPSGKTVGWSSMALPSTMTPDEQGVHGFALLRKILSEVENRPTDGKFWVRPEVYDQVPGMRQMLLDAGGSEYSFPAIGGTAIQMTNDQARVLAVALDTDTMGGLKVTAKSTADYLGFDAQKLDDAISKEPMVAMGHTFSIGDESPVAQITVSGSEMTFFNIADASPATVALTAVGEIYWAANNGIDRLKIGAHVFEQVPKLDKYLIALGGVVEADGMVLDAKALNAARKIIAHDALPLLLGGDKLPYSIVDDLNAISSEVMAAAHTELKASVALAEQTTFVVKERTVTSSWQRSGENLFWKSLDRGNASVSATRTAAAAQLRSFLNDMAQNGGIMRLDVDLSVFRDAPTLRDVLAKYGAKEIGASKTGDAYLSLERGKALKLRKELEVELAGVPQSGATYIQQQANSIMWPTVEELSASTSMVAQKAVAQGQTRKAVFVDKDGNEWMFKPGASGRGAQVDKAAAQLAERLGLPIPPVRIYELMYEGRMVSGSLQKMVPNARGLTGLDELSPAQTADLMRHSVLDWLVNNDDAHISNWLVDDSGRLWSIDKSRGWQTFHGSHDVLDTASNGNGGGKPLIFQFWADAARDPTRLAKLAPNDVAQVFRRLRDISDDEFARIVEPAARASQLPRYKGKPDLMVKDMLARKNEAVRDFEVYFKKEVQKMMAGPRAASVPAPWQKWVNDGGTFNLDATPKDLWQERLTELNARFGEYTPTHAQQLLHANHHAPIRSELSAFYDGGAAAEPGEKKKGYGGEFIRPRLERKGHQKILEEWYALQEWVLLNVVNGKEAVGGYGNATNTIRQYWNAETGTFRVLRTVNRKGADPVATLDYYRKTGMRDVLSTAIGRTVTVGGHGGVVLYMDVPYNRVFSSWAGGFNAGEQEFVTYLSSVDWIVHVAPQSRPLPMSAVMTYQGPVLPK